MPSGYTYLILDGKIKTFEEFALVCMKAFCLHMRDEGMLAPYKPDKPSDYAKRKITEYRLKLKKIEKLSDDEIISGYQKDLLEEQKSYVNLIDTAKRYKIKLDPILREAEQYVPPSKKHHEIND